MTNLNPEYPLMDIAAPNQMLKYTLYDNLGIMGLNSEALNPMCLLWRNPHSIN